MDDRNLIYAVLAISVISLVANVFVMLEIGKEGPGPRSVPANAVSGCKNLCNDLNLGGSCETACMNEVFEQTNQCVTNIPRERGGCQELFTLMLYG